MIGILSTIDNPLLPYLLDEIEKKQISPIALIFDSKTISKKDKLIWERRTGGVLRPTRETNQELRDRYRKRYKCLFLDSHISEDAIEQYKIEKISCLLNAGTPRKISRKVIKNIKQGVLNIHPGKLPEYRGCSCVEWAILNDEQIANSAHLMSEDYDQGPIIKIETYNFDKKSTYKDIRSQTYLYSCKLAAECLYKIKNGECNEESLIVQDEQKAKLWKPMPFDLEEKAIKKANDHLYRYQNK